MLFKYRSYVFFIRQPPGAENLVSSVGLEDGGADSLDEVASLDQDFLPMLLSVKTIRLDDSIFSDPAFMSLVDGSIELIPEGNEGRPNPFAPLGAENSVSSTSSSGSKTSN